MKSKCPGDNKNLPLLLWGLNLSAETKMAKNKKQDILKAAANLFSSQGYNNSTTLQIAKEARVTEPLLYYHFQGKEEIFTTIIQEAFQEYVRQIHSLPGNTKTEFEKIASLIRLHMHIGETDSPDFKLIMSNCPSKLVSKKHACRDIQQKQQEIVSSYIRDCLEAGNAKGEFEAQPVDHMTLILLSLINEFLYMKIMSKKQFQPDEQSVMEFCKRSLLPS